MRARAHTYTHTLYLHSCNLLYALVFCEQVRHTCCLSLLVYVHCIACNCMVLYVPRWLSSMPEPVIPPGRLAQIDLSCVDVP